MKDKLVLTCSCGCGSGIEFHAIENDVIYVSCFRALFYTKQSNSILELIDDIRHWKQSFYFEIMLTRHDLFMLRRFLKMNKISDESVDNLTELCLYKELLVPKRNKDNKYIYSLMVEGKPSLFQAIFKSHRLYEISLNKRMVDKLCSKITQLIGIA